jgi:dTDP-4-dehydrorhamnose reductase
MSRATLLVTGGSGLLGLNWACAMRREFDVVLSTHTRHAQLAGARSVGLSLENADSLGAAFREIEPAIVVHAAGLTSVDECERVPDLARHVHVDLTRNVARAAAAAGSKLIHISTDHLFAGTRPLYTEIDAPEPLNVYGRTKLEAERVVEEESPGALIVRTNFFGWGHRYRQSFSDWIYYALGSGESITLFDDVFITPILADRLAAFAHRLLAAGGAGVHNVVGDERVSKYEFGVRLAHAFALPKSLICRGKIACSSLRAKRPPDMSLDNGKAQSRLGTSLGSVDENLSVLRDQSRTGRRDELIAAVTE